MESQGVQSERILTKEQEVKKDKKTQSHENQCYFMKIVYIVTWLGPRSRGEEWGERNLGSEAERQTFGHTLVIWSLF